MHNYSYDNVISLLESIGANDVYHGYRLKWLKLNYPNLLNQIIYKTKFLGTASSTERLYCYTNNIVERPLCKMCNKHVTFNRVKQLYHTYCGRNCSILDMKTLIGVVNSSQLESVREKKKIKSLEKYGVDNVSKAVSVQEKISKKRKDYWDRVYQSKNFTTDGLSRLEYARRCHQYADTQYQRYKHVIDPESKRSKDWHVDHIYSVTDGFLNDIPINVISDITNLRLIPAVENYKKFKSSHKTLQELYEDYEKFNYAASTSSTPTFDS